MKKILFLIGVIGLMQLTGCIRTNDNVVPKTDTSNLNKNLNQNLPTNTINLPVQTNTGNNANITNPSVQPNTGNNTNITNPINITSTGNTSNIRLNIYIDSSCMLQICLQSKINEIITKEFGIVTGNITYIDIRNNKDQISKFEQADLNKLPLIEIESADLTILSKKIPQMTSFVKELNKKFYLPLFIWEAGKENICDDKIDNDGNGLIDEKDPGCTAVTILYDSRCNEGDLCDINSLVGNIKQQIFPVGYNIITTNYNSGGKELYNNILTKLNSGSKKDNKLLLPSVIVKDLKDKQLLETFKLQGMIDILTGMDNKYILKFLPSTWDPKAEICDNGIDDNNDKLIDCADPTCSAKLVCKKVSKPNVELFVMSHCPFGTQVEKAIIPVLDLLKNKIDFNLKFVNYSMHGETEVYEEINQYCIQKNLGKDVLINYLKCFLKDGKTDECIKETKITNLDKCIQDTKTTFKIEEILKDKSKWSGGRFPNFPIFEEDNKKYQVAGSPTFVLNGIKIDNAPRNPAGLLKIICNSFQIKPAECSQNIDTKDASSGFGFVNNPSTPGTNNNASCGN